MTLALPGRPLPQPGHPVRFSPSERTLHSLRLRHPEAVPAAVVVGAWIALVLLGTGVPGVGASRPAGVPAGSMPGMAGMPGMTGMPGMAAAHPGTPWWSQALGGLPDWLLMVVAMMGPAALGGLRHTGINTLRWRRRRAMAEYAAAYLAVWAVFGAAVLGVMAVVPARLTGYPTLAVTLGGAAAWQLGILKRRSLRACHRSVPLPARGWPAERGALRFGWRNGLACVGSCWCLMLAMVAAPAGQLLWTAGLAVLVTAERWVERPRRVTRGAAPLLGLAAVGAAAAALV